MCCAENGGQIQGLRDPEPCQEYVILDNLKSEGRGLVL